MAHTYVVNPVDTTHVDFTLADPGIPVTGSVDGEPVSVVVYLSQIPANATVAQLKNVIAPIMLAQAQQQIAARTKPTIVLSFPSGTFTQ